MNWKTLVLCVPLVGCDAEQQTLVEAAIAGATADQAAPPPGAVARWKAIRRGSATVVPDALFIGEIERAVIVQPLRPRQPAEVRCAYSWPLVAASVANLSSCPDCLFGFDLDTSAPTDLLAQGGLGTSNCPNLAPPSDILAALSPATGEFLWSTGGAPYSVYTQDYTYQPAVGFASPNFEWSSSSSWRYVY